MGLFEQTTTKAKEIVDIAGKKTGDFIELQKLKINAASLQSAISKEYEALGRIFYENQKNESENLAYGEIISSIDNKLEDLKILNAKIALAKGEKSCPACCSVNNDDALFCNRCGQKLVFEETESE